MPMDWVYGLLGGLLIGAGGAVFLLMNGKVMGLSGLIGGLVDRSGWSSAAERIAFLAATAVAAGLLAWLAGGIDSTMTTNPAILIAGGLMVGLGTRLANGCTSGHGVCGISRLSLRGIVATLIYIGAGVASVVVFRHLLGVI